MVQTQLINLIDPQVMADMVSAELPNLLRFNAISNVNTDLQGRPGSKLLFPSYEYIGDAADIAEGVAIPLDRMTTSEKEVAIKKAAKGVEITDEAVLSGLGDPIGEANRQLALSIANKVDNDLLAAAQSATQATAAGAFNGTVAGLQAGLDIFADEGDEPIVLFAHPKDAAALRLNAGSTFLSGSELGANAIVNGTYGEILGVQIVRSRKITERAPILVKRGALALVMKRDVQVEADRDITTKTTVITADEHYAAYLYDGSKVVKFTAPVPTP